MCMQNFIKIYQKVQEIGPVSLFSEFEPRQNLDKSQMTFDNLLGYILSISRCLQNFITIFHSVQEIGPFSLFSECGARQSLDRDKCHFAISWARSCQYQCVCKSVSKYSKRFTSYWHFSLFSEFETTQILDQCQMTFDNLLGVMMNGIWQSICLLLSITCVCKILTKYTKRFLQNLNFGKTSTNPKWYLTISWATSCQCQGICKIS